MFKGILSIILICFSSEHILNCFHKFKTIKNVTETNLELLLIFNQK